MPATGYGDASITRRVCGSTHTKVGHLARPSIKTASSLPSCHAAYSPAVLYIVLPVGMAFRNPPIVRAVEGQGSGIQGAERTTRTVGVHRKSAFEPTTLLDLSIVVVVPSQWSYRRRATDLCRSSASFQPARGLLASRAQVSQARHDTSSSAVCTKHSVQVDPRTAFSTSHWYAGRCLRLRAGGSERSS